MCWAQRVGSSAPEGHGGALLGTRRDWDPGSQGTHGGGSPAQGQRRPLPGGQGQGPALPPAPRLTGMEGTGLAAGVHVLCYFTHFMRNWEKNILLLIFN